MRLSRLLMYLLLAWGWSCILLAIIASIGALMGPAGGLVGTAVMIAIGLGTASWLLKGEDQELKLSMAAGVAVATVVMAFILAWIIRAGDAPTIWPRPLPIWLEPGHWILFGAACSGALTPVRAYLRALRHAE